MVSSIGLGRSQPWPDSTTRPQAATIRRVHLAFDVAPLRREPAGVGQFTVAMATALADLLGSSMTFIGQRGDAAGLPSDVPSIPFSGRGYSMWLQLVAPRAVRRSRADVAHFTQGMVPVVRTVPTVLSVHDMSLVRLWRYHPPRRLLQIPLVLAGPRLATLVVVPSRSTADEVIRLTSMPAKRIEVIPYGIQRGVSRASEEEVTRVLSRHKLDRGAFILALGTIEPRKNHRRLVEAFEVALRKRLIPPETQLVIAGGMGWHARGIIRRMEQSPVASKIRHLGFVPSGDTSALMSGAAAVAYVSVYEGFGFPVLESMACGAPTVTSRTSSMPEVAGDAAFLVNPWQVDDIARGVAAAISAGDRDPSGVADAAIRQAARFSWARAAGMMADVYRRAAA